METFLKNQKEMLQIKNIVTKNNVWWTHQKQYAEETINEIEGLSIGTSKNKMQSEERMKKTKQYARPVGQLQKV